MADASRLIGLGVDMVYFWLDYHIVRQGIRGDFVPDSVKQVIKDLKGTVLLPGPVPAGGETFSSLKRAWVVYEVLKSIEANKPILVVPTVPGLYGGKWAEDKVLLERTVQDLKNKNAVIRLQDCEARDKADEDSVKAQCFSLGVDNVNTNTSDAVTKGFDMYASFGDVDPSGNNSRGKAGSMFS